MAKFADGHVFIYKPRRTHIEIEERELVMCRSCKYLGSYGCADFCIRLQKIVDEPDWYCADGEKEEQ